MYFSLKGSADKKVWESQVTLYDISDYKLSHI